MKTQALLWMISVQVVVAAITLWLILKVLKTKRTGRQKSDSELN